MCAYRESDDRAHLLLLLKVARRYYEDRASQQEVAAEIGYSRPTVSRLLDEARRRGIVRIQVGHPLERVLRVERALARRFGLTDARVIDPGNRPTGAALAECAAQYVTDVTTPTSVIAISNGSTVSDVVDAFHPLHRPESWVVQMIGTLGRDNTLVDSPDLCRRLAQYFGGRYRIMPAPLVVGSKRLAAALRREESVATALTLGSRADLALLGIGAVGPTGSGSIFDGWMTPNIAAELKAARAVGHLCGHHFDDRGNHISDELCQRVMSVPIERLHDIPRVIAVARGDDKIAAIRGALLGNYVDVLVTDATTAHGVLAA